MNDASIGCQQSSSDPRPWLIDSNRLAPLVVVGLPRSGSSYFSFLLSQFEDWYVYDDLYFYREVRAIGITGPLSRPQLARCIQYLYDSARLLITSPKFGPPFPTVKALDDFTASFLKSCEGRTLLWFDVIEEWLRRVAQLHGRTRWGFKTPQAFMYMKTLHEIWPDLKVIHLLRDPRDIMASMKYVRRRDGHPGQYHPIAYSLYWRMSISEISIFSQENAEALLELRFEDMIAESADALSRVAQLLDSSKYIDIVPALPNSSFVEGTRRSITCLERWFCESLAGAEMEARGYQLTRSKPRLRDFFDFVAISLRFGWYQAKRLGSAGGARQSVAMYLRSMIRSAPRWVFSTRATKL